MRKVPFTSYLHPKQLKTLTEISKTTFISMAELIRQGVDLRIEKENKK